MLLKPRPVPVPQNLHMPKFETVCDAIEPYEEKKLCHQTQKYDKNNGCFPITAQETAALRKLLTKVKDIRIYFERIISKSQKHLF